MRCKDSFLDWAGRSFHLVSTMWVVIGCTKEEIKTRHKTKVMNESVLVFVSFSSSWWMSMGSIIFSWPVPRATTQGSQLLFPDHHVVKGDVDVLYT